MTTETLESDVQRAADYLSAAQLPDGRWAYFALETGRWYVMGDDDMARLVRYLDHEDPDVRRAAYSIWCTATPTAAEMPEGWAPEE